MKRKEAPASPEPESNKAKLRMVRIKITELTTTCYLLQQYMSERGARAAIRRLETEPSQAKL